jgi:hypothetical protein
VLTVLAYLVGPIPLVAVALLVLRGVTATMWNGAPWAASAVVWSDAARRSLQGHTPWGAVVLVLGGAAVVEAGLRRETGAGIRARTVARASLSELWAGAGDTRRLRAVSLLWWHAAVESSRALVLWPGLCHLLAWQVLASTLLLAPRGPLVAVPGMSSLLRCLTGAILGFCLARAQGRRRTLAVLVAMAAGAFVGHWATGALAWYALGAGISRLLIVHGAARQSPLYSLHGRAADSLSTAPASPVRFV